MILLGGPLITKNDDDDEKWYQYGILHGGAECESAEKPAIFNLVENVKNLNWINKIAFNESGKMLFLPLQEIKELE